MRDVAGPARGDFDDEACSATPVADFADAAVIEVTEVDADSTAIYYLSPSSGAYGAVVMILGGCPAYCSTGLWIVSTVAYINVDAVSLGASDVPVEVAGSTDRILSMEIGSGWAGVSFE